MAALPSFQIDITEIPFTKGKSVVHKIARDTVRVITSLEKGFTLPEEIVVERERTLETEAGSERGFYTKIAGQLSVLDSQQLMDNFSDLRICNKDKRSVRNFDFKFDYF
jgi:hypothetical protein